MAWMDGASYNTDGSWNAYSTYANGGSYQQPYTQGFMSDPGSSSSSSGINWNGVAQGLGAYDDASTSSTSSVLNGAAEGWYNGGWTGAVVGALAGYYGSEDKDKENEEDFERKKELDLAKYKYMEEIRQKQIQETKDAFSKYKGLGGPPMTNNLFGTGAANGGMMGAFAPQGPTQPVVNPEQNSYGLMRG